MRSLLSVVMLAAVLCVLTGCNPENSPNSAPPANPSANAKSAAPAAIIAEGAPEGSIKVGDMAVCAICMVNAGKPTEPEPVKDVLNYKGKTYAFCNQDEKAEFISNPTKYAGK